MSTVFNNPELKLAFDFAEYTGQNIFLTGKAGTGKTTFLHNFKNKTSKRMIVVAPTGVAAINAGGVTIHSFFQMPFGPFLPQDALILPFQNSNYISRINVKKMNRTKIKIIKSLDLLVIDEVSMVRADLLDGIDEVLRRFKNRYLPFGGVQLLMIGDLQQLPPIVPKDEWALLKDYYQTLFFFGSRALQHTSYVSIELKHIFRQNDSKFINLLNNVRQNRLDDKTLNELNRKYIPNFTVEENDAYITLTTHNKNARVINDAKLKKLDSMEYCFSAEVKDEFPRHAYPTDEKLVLKVDAQVMFVKNDISEEKLYFNGKIGKIVKITDDYVSVKCPDDNKTISVDIAEWKNIKYTINNETNAIEESVTGTFKQYPLKLAWAITIHKSQGLTFDKAIIDANAAFAHGQVYVALSRCRSFDGLILSSLITKNCIKVDPDVLQFTSKIEENPPGDNHFNHSNFDFQFALLRELFDFTPMQRMIISGLKIINENKGSIPSYIAEAFVPLNDSLKKEIVDIANKFDNQLKRLPPEQKNIEENSALQERIKKGCAYFIEKIESLILNSLNKLTLEIDNKAIKKSLNHVISELKKEIDAKLICLRTCSNGFTIKRYMDIRAKSVIEASQRKKEKKNEKTDLRIAPDNIKNPEIYSKLKAWREKKAKEEEVPLYMVLPNKTMIEIASLIPKSKRILKTIKGIGKKKLQLYGDDILSCLSGST
ncbi:helicase [Candidatus Magnetomorum sp. HK-1]|nr:helicase [Candidatus Magnetomorum sp. HK-1]